MPFLGTIPDSSAMSWFLSLVFTVLGFVFLALWRLRSIMMMVLGCGRALWWWCALTCLKWMRTHTECGGPQGDSLRTWRLPASRVNAVCGFRKNVTKEDWWGGVTCVLQRLLSRWDLHITQRRPEDADTTRWLCKLRQHDQKTLNPWCSFMKQPCPSETKGLEFFWTFFKKRTGLKPSNSKQASTTVSLRIFQPSIIDQLDNWTHRRNEKIHEFNPSAKFTSVCCWLSINRQASHILFIEQRKSSVIQAFERFLLCLFNQTFGCFLFMQKASLNDKGFSKWKETPVHFEGRNSECN